MKFTGKTLILMTNVIDEDIDVVAIVVPEQQLMLPRVPFVNNTRYVMYHSFQYATVREALKEHFYYQYQKGLVQWPKKFKDIQKETFPLTRAAIINRVNIEYERVLYIQSSTLRSQDRRSGLFYLLIGDGLFSNIDYNAGDHIADYVGELISAVEALRREEAGRGGYTIYITETVKMDCYDACVRGDCKASKANSSTRAFNSITNAMAISNAKMVSSTSGLPRVRLQASKKIPKHSEIITTYGKGFRFPIEA